MIYYYHSQSSVVVITIEYISPKLLVTGNALKMYTIIIIGVSVPTVHRGIQLFCVF